MPNIPTEIAAIYSFTFTQAYKILQLTRHVRRDSFWKPFDKVEHLTTSKNIYTLLPLHTSNLSPSPTQSQCSAAFDHIHFN